MPSKKNENYVLKWRCNWELSFLILILGTIFCVVMVALIFCGNYKLFLSLAVVGLVLTVLGFVLSLFGFNKLIYLNQDEIFCYARGKKYEWRWDEITNTDTLCVPFRFPMLIVKITTRKDYKKLSFSVSSFRYKELSEICPNASVLTKLREFFEIG